ncbi:ecotin family protein, partial [Pseudomonas aeruginosa]|uniref:ecotin family protein n=1 Tax=Pseudomonas aeruginosa TaxID=287 RepID=UPI0023AA3E8A
IHLPKQDAEDAFKVEIIAGKTLEADCNQQRLGGELEEHTLEGWRRRRGPARSSS